MVRFTIVHSKTEIKFPLLPFYYGGTPFIQSAMGQKILAILMGDGINEGFLQENV